MRYLKGHKEWHGLCVDTFSRSLSLHRRVADTLPTGVREKRQRMYTVEAIKEEI